MTFQFLFCHTDTVICAVFRPMGIINFEHKETALKALDHAWQRPQVGGQEAGGSLAWRWAEAFLCWTFPQGLQNGLSGNASCETICPQDHPKNVRFAINYFTAIGLGVLTEERLLNMTNRRTWHQKHIETLKHSKSSYPNQDDHMIISIRYWKTHEHRMVTGPPHLPRASECTSCRRCSEGASLRFVSFSFRCSQFPIVKSWFKNSTYIYIST